MYTLFYSPGACSIAVHALLNELNVPFTLENTAITEGKNRTPEFLKLNPRGQVPVLVEDGKAIREGAAIIIHLLEKHQSPLLPTSGDARTAAFEWLMFCNATLHPAYSRLFFLNRNVEEGETKEKLMGVGIAAVNKLWEEVEERLTKNAFLAGDKMTAADILLTVIANWSPRFPTIVLGNHTKALLKKVSTLPSYQKALQAEQVEYKAAA